MFRKIFIANRGEIAARIIRTCHDLGIQAVAAYHIADRGSLHVRLADACIELASSKDFMNQDLMVELAHSAGADAIHPGYGFLAERADFVQRCQQAGLVVIGPPADTVAQVTDKVFALEKARLAGFPVVDFSTIAVNQGASAQDRPEVYSEAERLGYPVVVKPRYGGRGRGERLIHSAERLSDILLGAQTEAQIVYGNSRVYLEKALHPVHKVGVQILGDSQGNLVHLGEREGSVIIGNQKYFEETPAPCLSSIQRDRLWQAAVGLARLFDYQNVGTVEFIVDNSGQFFFSEIKARIPIEHPLPEMIAQVDLVREQIRLSAGELLGFSQAEIHLNGWAMECRISAEDPWKQFLPSPGRLRRARLPAGPGVRVDTYVYTGCDVPTDYDPLIAKLTVWGADRTACLARMQRALEECKLIGPPNNLPSLQRILRHPHVRDGVYSVDFLVEPLNLNSNCSTSPSSTAEIKEAGTARGADENGDSHLRDMAVAAAIIYLRRLHTTDPKAPERLTTGWHRASRRLPD